VTAAIDGAASGNADDYAGNAEGYARHPDDYADAADAGRAPHPPRLLPDQRRAERRQPSPDDPLYDDLAAANRELARRQSFMDALLETIEVGIVSCDAAGTLVVTNRAERALFGLSGGLEGTPVEHLDDMIDVIEPGGRRLRPHEYPLARALRGEPLGALDMIVGPAGGPHREIVVRGRQIVGPDGAVLGAVAALTDVTAERSATRALAEEHRRLVEAQRLGRLGSFEFDVATGSWMASEQLSVLWGLERVHHQPELARSLIVDEDRDRAVASWYRAMHQPGPHSYEIRIRRANDGLERVLSCTVETEFDADGNAVRVRGTHVDITDLSAAEQTARQATAFFDAILTASPDYTFVTDVETRAVIYGSRGKDVLGITTEELQALGSDVVALLVHPDDQDGLRAIHRGATEIADGEVLQTRYRARHINGEWRWLSHRVTPFRRDATGRVLEVLAVVRDVTDVVEAEERLTHAARHDTLTGLANRAALMERLALALARSRRVGREIAVLYCDLDGFKQVNDTEGHAVGDAVLLEAARRLGSVLRADDTVARLGGDEFVVVVEPWNRRAGGSEPVAETVATARGFGERVAERIIAALREPMRVGDTDHVVTVSVGIAYAGGSDTDGAGPEATADGVLHAADLAMYRAKDRGKDCFEVFDGDLGGDEGILA